VYNSGIRFSGPAVPFDDKADNLFLPPAPPSDFQYTPFLIALLLRDYMTLGYSPQMIEVKADLDTAASRLPENQKRIVRKVMYGYDLMEINVPNAAQEYQTALHSMAESLKESE
jgi:hypothetical protein